MEKKPSFREKTNKKCILFPKIKRAKVKEKKKKAGQRVENGKREHKAFKNVSGNQKAGKGIISKSTVRLQCCCVDQFI